MVTQRGAASSPAWPPQGQGSDSDFFFGGVTAQQGPPKPRDEPPLGCCNGKNRRDPPQALPLPLRGASLVPAVTQERGGGGGGGNTRAPRDPPPNRSLPLLARGLPPLGGLRAAAPGGSGGSGAGGGGDGGERGPAGPLPGRPRGLARPSPLAAVPRQPPPHRRPGKTLSARGRAGRGAAGAGRGVPGGASRPAAASPAPIDFPLWSFATKGRIQTLPRFVQSERRAPARRRLAPSRPTVPNRAPTLTTNQRPGMRPISAEEPEHGLCVS